MAKNTDWLKEKISGLDDEAFVEVAASMAEEAADRTEPVINSGVVHITEKQDEITEEYQNWGKVKGIRTGYKALDKMIGGFDQGDVILIGGETNNGKSAMAANIAVNVSKTQGVLYITLEMLIRQIGSRIMHINNGSIDGLDLMFQEEHRLTYKDLKPLVKNAMEQGEVKMVMLDYLQYLGRGMKPEEVAVMSKEVKTLALEFKIPFVVIVSLRKSESGKQKRRWTDIEIDDFMGTGSIGYDADAAMIVSRKDVSNDFDEDGIWVKVLKVRNGKLDWDKRFIRLKWEQTRITDDEFYTIGEDGWQEAE